MNVDIGDVRGRHGNETDIAEDAGQPPHVLIFQVRTIGPLDDLDGDLVEAGVDPGGDVEFRWQPAAFAEPDLFAVDPDMKRGIHAFKAQPNLAVVPVVADKEVADVGAGRVLGRHVGRIDREGELDVGVMRSAVAVHLPARGDRDLGPVGGLGESGGCLGRRGGPVKLPIAIEQLEPGRGVAVESAGAGFVRVRCEKRAGGKPIAAGEGRVFPIFWSRWSRHNVTQTLTGIGGD